MTDISSPYPLSAAVAGRLIVLAEVGSTNDELAASARTSVADWPDFSVVISDVQTAGKGRQGRSWVAPSGTMLAISVLLRSGGTLPPDAIGWLPLAGGLAMTRAVNSALSTADVEARAQLKWPNDVLVGGKKICGVLSELVDPAELTVVVGAGVNLSMTAEQLPVGTATSLAVLGVARPDPDAVLRDYLVELRTVIQTLRAAGGDARASGLLDAVTAACGTIGAAVRVELPGGGLLEGTAKGIDASGRIVVQDGESGELVPVAAGDVTHLRTVT